MDKKLHLDLALLANELFQQAKFLDQSAASAENSAASLRRRSEDLRSEAAKLTELLPEPPHDR